MKKIHLLFPLFALLLSSCVGVPGTENERVGGGSRVNVRPGDPRVQISAPAGEEKEYDADMISKALKKADFEFYNASMYKDPNSWKGATVCVLGEYPGTGPRSRQYIRNDREFYLSGDFNGHTIALIVMLDHPLPKEMSYDKPVRTISASQEIFVLGTLQGLESVTDESGYTRSLPLLKCLLICDKNDPSFSRPLWISSVFQRMPEGTVTTDSLKYEFDRPTPR